MTLCLKTPKIDGKIVIQWNINFSMYLVCFCGPQYYNYSNTGSEPFLMEYRLRALIRRFFTLVSTKGEQGRWEKKVWLCVLYCQSSKILRNLTFHMKSFGTPTKEYTKSSILLMTLFWFWLLSELQPTEILQNWQMVIFLQAIKYRLCICWKICWKQLKDE